ncbi:MAG: Na+/H+ antiporter NhaA [Acidobacteria bacterium]|nr:Na+/H+ antiporter NhaA [Acidobacteriota bacterium]MCB9397394.1 Na+/H+ antiporter NhaA [Acidobacteriota bacterium]
MAHKSADKPISPIQEFFQAESSSGILLMIVTALALIIANSGWGQAYREFFEVPFGIGLGDWAVKKPLILWINDGLMAVFFLLIGLEIKREILFGELSTWKSASLPLVAAVGGCVVPALVFWGFTHGTEYVRGWGIPMATDIAFALGILTLLGSRIPAWAKIFLTALAVVDDLIAVLVIAVFYTESIHWGPLMLGLGCLVVLIVFNLREVHRLGPYLLVGLVLWFAVLKSGIHATIAGVLVGFLIPGRLNNDRKALLARAESGVAMLKQFLNKDRGPDKELLQSSLNYLGDVVIQAEPPLYRLEHKLHSWVAFGIIPIFAFANAGVALSGPMVQESFQKPLTWAIAIGLIAGKQIGIFGAVFLMARLTGAPQLGQPGLARIYYGLACLGGIGFTMSLFVSGLAFADGQMVELSKIGILAGSLFSGLMGFVLLKGLPAQPPAPT